VSDDRCSAEGDGAEAAAAGQLISDEVDRVLKRHSGMLMKNIDRCDLPTLAQFGSVLLRRPDHGRQNSTRSRSVSDVNKDTSLKAMAGTEDLTLKAKARTKD